MINNYPNYYPKQIGGKMNFNQIDPDNYIYQGDGADKCPPPQDITYNKVNQDTLLKIQELVPYLITKYGTCYLTDESESESESEDNKQLVINSIRCIGYGMFSIAYLFNCPKNNLDIIFKVIKPNLPDFFIDEIKRDLDINRLLNMSYFPFTQYFLGYLNKLKDNTEDSYYPENLFVKNSKVTSIIDSIQHSNSSLCLFFEKLNGKFNDLQGLYHANNEKIHKERVTIGNDLISAVFLILDILFAVIYLYKNGYYHCDIKADNVAYGHIFLEKTVSNQKYHAFYHYQLIDFGCTSLISDGECHCTGVPYRLERPRCIDHHHDNDIIALAILFNNLFIKRFQHAPDMVCEGYDIDKLWNSNFTNRYKIDIEILFKRVIKNLWLYQHQVAVDTLVIDLFFHENKGLFNRQWISKNKEIYNLIKYRYNVLLDKCDPTLKQEFLNYF